MANSQPLLIGKPKRTVPKQFQKTARKLAKQPKKKAYGFKSMSNGYRGP